MGTENSSPELTFQHIVNSMPNAILLAGQDGTVNFVNAQAEKLFYRNKSGLIGKELSALLPERHRHLMQSASSSLQDSGKNNFRVLELSALNEKGKEFPIEMTLSLMDIAPQQQVLVLIVDITERKKAEVRFRMVVESAPNAMILVGVAGQITMVNGQAEVLFGYKRSELIGNTLEMLIPERFRKEHAGFRKTYFTDPVTRSMGAGRDLFALRKDGSEVEVEIGLNPIETSEGLVILASIIDITERKNNEALIRKHLEELEQKNKELAQFAYIASHDLQEPLRTVSNYVQVIEEDYPDVFDDDAKKYFGSIKLAVSRMSSLVRALLYYSRLGVDKTLVRLDCNLLIKDVLDDLEDGITNSGARITIGDLPVLMGNETGVRQVFQNLISNGIKFAKENSTPSIIINSKKLPGRWEFSVSDNGIGIDPVHFDKIFLIFQRLHKGKKYEGSGIGLANCKKIVELHGGRIWVDSQPGNGAVFYFTIPDNHGSKTK